MVISMIFICAMALFRYSRRPISNQTQVLNLCAFGLTKRLTTRNHHIGEANVQSFHIARAVGSVIPAAGKVNVTQQFRNAGSSLMAADKNGCSRFSQESQLWNTRRHASGETRETLATAFWRSFGVLTPISTCHFMDIQKPGTWQAINSWLSQFTPFSLTLDLILSSKLDLFEAGFRKSEEGSNEEWSSINDHKCFWWWIPLDNGNVLKISSNEFMQMGWVFSSQSALGFDWYREYCRLFIQYRMVISAAQRWLPEC
jgi:hypothetical protein